MTQINAQMVEELYEVIPRVQEPQEMEKGIC
jgi:hypothetical protein